ncbi:alpha/beta hydrolase [Microlunatus lacustris]
MQSAGVLGLAACGRRPASTDQEEPLLRYRYGDHPSQYAELALPAGAGVVPVVVVVHGGFWRDAYDASLARPLAADLTPRGWAALVVEYRRVGRSRTDGGGGWPQTLLDVAAALDGLAGPGQELAGGRLDLDRVVALGHSAGGQLAGWLAARPGLPAGVPGAQPAVRLSGVVSQAGVLDLAAAAREGVGGRAVPDLMGGGPDERAADYRLASPAARLPLGVPSVCVHGTDDSDVPHRQSADFVAAARAAGDRSELHSFPGDHLAPITVGTPAWALCTDALTGLLAG